ncbi:MAG: patatin family protein [Solirubrobacterales bacterium]
MTAVEHPVLRLLGERVAAGSRPGERSDGARLALAIEGGGMRGAITGGMALAIDELGIVAAFDDVYGASAGALNAAWLLSGAASTGIRTWTDPALRTASVRRGNLLRGRPIVDSSYLTEVVYERLAPMPFDRILDGDVGFHPLATDAATGEAVDLAPLIDDRATLKLALRATTALPLLSGRPIELGGRRFFDAGLAESIPFRTAIAQGATHLLVLRSRREGEQESANSGRSARLVARYLSRHSIHVADAFLGRAERLIREDDELGRAEADPEAVPAIVSLRPPPATPAISRLEKDHQRVLAGLEAGRREATTVLGAAIG